MGSSGLITILFTDLVGSTELASDVGDLAADVLRRDHFTALREAVAATGGTEVKTIGDALMVSYAGAADALTGAATMQQAVERHNRRLDGRKLAMRVGISAGDATFEDGDWFGAPVVESARLCAAATGGQVLTSDLVRLLAGSRTEMELRPVGELELKGLPAPLAACELVWSVAGTGTGLTLPAFVEVDPAFPFAGRRDARELLLAAWKEAAEGTRRTVLVSGEPGIGKTRLVTELVRYAHEHGSVVLWGRSDEELGAPFGPFAEALRHYVATVAPDRLRSQLGATGNELVRIVPDLASTVPGLAEPMASDADAERFRLFESVVDLLAEISAADPVVLVLDDLHWADRPSLLLLRHLLRSSTPMRVLVLATYRDTDLSRTHPLSDVLADLRREPGVQRLDLQGLDVDEVGGLLSSTAGHDLDESGLDLARSLQSETEGNPFFLGEVVRHLVESGALVQNDDGRWVAGVAPGDFPIPEGIREVVGKRLSNLSDDLNQALTIAAVIGPVFDLAVVEGAGGPAGDALFDALDEATTARLVREVPGSPGRYTFAHALVRSALYEELSTNRRVRLHWRIGEVLEGRYGRSIDAHLDELAHHYGEGALAGDPARAVEFARRAGELALGDLAFEAAAAHFAHALGSLELDDQFDQTVRVDLLLARATAFDLSGDEACRPPTFEAAALARSLGDDARFVRAALLLVERHMAHGTNFDEEVVLLLEEALDLVGPEPSVARVKLLASLAVELQWSAQRARRIALAAEALEMARGLADPAGLAFVMPRSWAMLDGSTPWAHDFSVLMAEAEVAARSAANLVALNEVQRLQFWMALEVGDIGRAREIHEQVRRSVGRQRDPAGERLLLVEDVAVAHHEGRLADAERLAGEYVARCTADRVPESLMMSTAGAQFYAIRSAQGRLDELVPTIAGLVEASPGAPVWRIALAGALIESDQFEAARESFDWLAADGCVNVPSDVQFPVTICGLARCSFLLDPGEHVVGPIYDKLLPFKGRFNWTGTTIDAPNDMGLAMAAEMLGRPDEADEHYADSIRLCIGADARTFEARAEFDWGRVLDRRGDRPAARSHLERALALGEEMGSVGPFGLVRRSRTLLDG